MNVSKNWLGASPEEVVKSLIAFAHSSDLFSSDQLLVEQYAHAKVGWCVLW